MADYIPATGAEFHACPRSFVGVANANLAGLGLVAADLPLPAAAQTTCPTIYPARVTAPAAATSARTAHVALLRAPVRRPHVGPQVDRSERAALGITVPDRGAKNAHYLLCWASTPGYSFIRGQNREPQLQVQYEFPSAGTFNVACKVQDDMGGEGTWTDKIEVE